MSGWLGACDGRTPTPGVAPTRRAMRTRRGRTRTPIRVFEHGCRPAPGRHRAAHAPTPRTLDTRPHTPPDLHGSPGSGREQQLCAEPSRGTRTPATTTRHLQPSPSPGSPPPGRPDAGALIRVSTPLRPVRRHELSISGPSRRAGYGRRRPPWGAPLAPPHPRAGCHPTQLPRSVRSLSAWIRVVARPEPTKF